MRKDLLFLAVLAFCAGFEAPAQANAQTSPPPAAQESREQRQALPPPILGLLGDRERLSLTSEQVTALDSIYERWNLENTRLTRTGMVMSTGITGTTFSRGSVAPSGPEARANHLRAAKEVEALLTDEQRRSVCELFSGRREPVNRLWPWCGGSR
jgi:hypothetical protein